MKLAFYYHIPITQKKKGLFIPGFLGVFIDALANEVEHLYLIMHKSNAAESILADYKLKNKNITFISLGLKTPAWHRAIFHKKILKQAVQKIDNCKALIVRSPSPLAPYFYKYLKNTTLVFMVVGDYMESVKHSNAKSLRERVIDFYLIYNDKKFKYIMKKVDVLVNSPILYEKYKENSKSIYLIKTTTLSERDFYFREDTCKNYPIVLLYSGRFDVQKGLIELVEATAQLLLQNIEVNLNLVGWEDNKLEPVKQLILKKAKDLSIEQNIFIHGKKTIGKDLNEMYTMADIYILPSYHEGFPRTIWEAMANSLPVIATDVGGIPAYLTHLKNVYLIKSKSADAITRAVIKISNDISLRKKMISYGRKIAKEATLEIQTKNMVDYIKKSIY